MLLQLKIINTSKDGLAIDSVKTFDQNGGVIGRKQDCDWTLPDNKRVISSNHAEIYTSQNSFYIRDVSTNGVFINYAKSALGKGSSSRLNSGDVICMGDYHIQVAKLVNHKAAAATEAFNWQANPAVTQQHALDPIDEILSRDPYPEPSSYRNFTNNAPEQPALDQMLSLEDASLDPLELMNAPQTKAADTDPLSAFLSEQSGPAIPAQDMPPPADPLTHSLDELLRPNQQATSAPQNNVTQFKFNHAFEAPPHTTTPDPKPSLQPSHNLAPAASVDPDSQSLQDLLDTPQPQVSEPIQQPEPLAQPAQPTPARPAVATKPLSPSAHNADWHQFMLDALGFDRDAKNHSQDSQAFFQVLADVTRASVSGLLKALKSRSMSKHKLNMNMTRIQPLDNNPLKFSASTEDALESLFLYHRKAFKNPVDAIQQGFEDLANHQEAMMKAMELTFQELLQHFSPKAIQQQRRKGFWAKLSTNPKGQNWAFYQRYHQQLSANPETSFRELYMNKFVQIYQQQLSQNSQNDTQSS